LQSSSSLTPQKIEEYIKTFGPGYYHVLVVGTEYSNSPLDIMKKGLKNDIKKQTINIIKDS